MALNNVIRRVTSRFVPMVLSQRGLRHHQTAGLFGAGSSCSSELARGFMLRLSPIFHHRYSTRPKSDEALLRVIDSEIKCAVESQEEGEDEGVPTDLPFKIEDTPGQQIVTLSREYQGETITVEVHMPDLITGEEDDRDDGDEDGEERANQSTMPLIVRVSKRNGPCLEFGCSAYPDEVSIDSLSIKDPKNSEDEIAYEGPDFADLDENLQKAFHKYLEIRGIKPSTTNFLHGYMVEKDGKEYLTWLKNLQKFIMA